MKKRLLLRCIHHFKSDLIHNMDHTVYRDFFASGNFGKNDAWKVC